MSLPTFSFTVGLSLSNSDFPVVQICKPLDLGARPCKGELFRCIRALRARWAYLILA